MDNNNLENNLPETGKVVEQTPVVNQTPNGSNTGIIIGIILGVVIIAVTLGIVINGSKNNKITVDDNETKINIITKDSKTAIIYFTETGTTEGIAKKVAKALPKADLKKIDAKEVYTEADLEYSKEARAWKEQQDANARVALKEEIDLSTYDVVYLGYPVWYGYTPKIFYTLIESNDLEGKTIIPFCTSSSSTIQLSVDTLKSTYPKLTIKTGKRFSADSTDEEVSTWVDSNY